MGGRGNREQDPDRGLRILWSVLSYYCQSVLGKVHHCAIFHTSLQLLLGGLLSEAEAGQLTLLPPADWPTMRRLSKMVKKPQ
jgi:hypothetical protein